MNLDKQHVRYLLHNLSRLSNNVANIQIAVADLAILNLKKDDDTQDKPLLERSLLRKLSEEFNELPILFDEISKAFEVNFKDELAKHGIGHELK